MSQNVSAYIQISDGGIFKDVTVNVEDLANAFNAVKAKASELEKSFVDMALARNVKMTPKKCKHISLCVGATKLDLTYMN